MTRSICASSPENCPAAARSGFEFVAIGIAVKVRAASAAALLLGVLSPALAADDIHLLRKDVEFRSSEGRAGGEAVVRAWTLERLVERALKAHPTIASRQAEIAAAGEGIEAAKWQFYPSPSVRVDQYQGDRVAGQGQQATVVSLQQPLWTGGRLSADLGAAREREAVSRGSLAETRLDLALRVAAVFGAWRTASARRVALESGIQQMLSLSASVARRSGAGVSAQADIDLVDVRMAQLRGDLAAAYAAQLGAQASLSELVGERIDTAPTAEDTLSAEEGSRLSVRERVDRALTINPSLSRLAAEAELARRQVEQAQAVAWPTVSLRAEHQAGSYPGSSSSGDRVFVSLNYVPGAGLSAGAQARAAEATARGKLDAVEAARRDLTARVAAESAEYEALRLRTNDAKAGLRAAEDVVASYKRMFLAGKRGWLDLLNAVRESINLEQQRGELQVQTAIAAWRLRAYAGELPWQADMPL